MDVLRKNNSFTLGVILLFILVIPLVNFSNHRYSRGEGVIIWDIKSYYAYLPAAFIYHDLSLDFMGQNPDKFNKMIWPVITPTGKKAIITTMGLSFLYAPFFFLAHGYALLSSKYEADGYSFPYHVALQFSTYVYFILALIILAKILKQYFDDKVTAITLLAIGAGTNLFYYVAHEAPMSHGYNFFLIVLFVWLLERWDKNISVKNTVFLGLLSGLIALIRPTNILLLLLIPLWKVGSFDDLKLRFKRLLKNWRYILLMAVAFVIVWLPQFAYWKYISGKFLYFSYGEKGGTFFWTNPQILKVLFSYEKGWFVYTPMMLLAAYGFFSLKRKGLKLVVPIVVYISVMIYVLSSWWSWWFGGSFGQRSMVDFYGLMAIPFAAFVEEAMAKKLKRIIVLFLIGGLILFNQFNIRQYHTLAINYWWMNKEEYWENFLHEYPTCKYWAIAQQPDYELARKGIYRSIAFPNKKFDVTDSMLIAKIVEDAQKNNLVEQLGIDTLCSPVEKDSIVYHYAKYLVDNKKAASYYKEIKISLYLKEINNCAEWHKEISQKAKKHNMSFDEMALYEAERIYNQYALKYDQQ